MHCKKQVDMNNEDTICAVATGRGGAIGIIRVSGGEAITAADRIFRPSAKNGLPLAQRKAYTIAYGSIINKEGETVDDVLVSVFRAPHSYTGEDSVEISCHGSAYILQQVMQLLIDNGCRSAEPGEFTRRALLNGKMDLSQAEAVADLIASSTKATHRIAMNQMRGAFSRELSSLRDKLLRLTSLLELELDFSDHEELEFADREELDRTAEQIEGVISGLVSSFSIGNAIKNGVPVAIVGETNAGKSTLLNALVGEDRAIVSDIHGTTRDVIEDTVTINGTMFRFIDTAGIRNTDNTIERLGIDRTFKKISQADIVLWIIDSTAETSHTEELACQIMPLCKEKQLVIVYNKTDITRPTSHSTISNIPEGTREISISAKLGTNLDALKRILIEAAGIPEISSSDVVVANIRHHEALTSALKDIKRVRRGMTEDLPSDLVAQDLRECLHHLAEITGGEITSEETLQNIFKYFCVGK